MKKLSSEEWEKKYIAGDIQRFDQKYTMFNRPGWDRDINKILDSWSFASPPAKNKPGYNLEDLALLISSGAGTQIGMFNFDKPVLPGPAQFLQKGMDSMMKKSSAVKHKLPENLKADLGSPQRATEMVKKTAQWFGADSVGICKLDRRWLYSHTYTEMPYQGPGGVEINSNSESIPQELPEMFQYAIVMCFEMDYDMIQYYPSDVSMAATARGYAKMAITNHHLSSFIKNLGYKVVNCTTNDVALSVPMAMQAGLGDIARNGLLITPKWGPRVRINAMVTDMPLSPDSPIDFGVTEFCKVCEICAEKCPSQSIMYGDRVSGSVNKSTAEGALKWPVNGETCRTYWSRVKRGCNICINVCPFNKPDTMFHSFIRWLADHARWGDRLYVLGDQLMGYEKPKDASKFWSEWIPRNV